MPTEPHSILFVITRGDSIGGAQIHVRDLAAGAAARGHRVAVAVGSDGPFVGLLDAAGVPALLVPGLGRAIDPVSDVKAVVGLRSLIRRWKPDLVACHTSKAGLVGRLAAFWARVPAQYTVHGWQFAEGISPLQRLYVLVVETLLARITQTIITVSEYDRKLALRARVAPPGRVVTVHNGMPDAPPAPASPGAATIRLIMVARFQPQKDHATLFAALETLEELPWSLHLVGDGPDLARWQAWVERRGWQRRVVFHGLSLEVPALLAQADVFVLASRWEGFPNSILEAMRTGLPVVASDVGGVAEAVAEGRTGLVVPPADPEALARALGRLLADRDLRREWGARGRERFAAEFTFERMLDKTERVWSGG
jgi:glycosyltransferase involved in cell wall biosynthesis